MPERLAYQDQSASDLVLSVVRGAINPSEFFSVFATDVIEGPGFSFRADIIGASHVINVSTDNISFSEVFACEQVNVDSRRIVYGPLRDFPVDETVRFSIGSIEYSFCPRITNWEEGLGALKSWENRAKDCRGKGDSIGLVHGFPKQKESMHTPKTIVVAIAKSPGDLVVKTVHSYPNEGNIVFTTTKINLK
jgi:hypothetical protein